MYANTYIHITNRSHRLLDIFAGPKAKQQLLAHGFQSELFDTILGASGGPKWFILAGLDKVIVPEFFSNSAHQVDLIGTSAGAFRMACLAQNNPLDAINRLAVNYSQTQYSDKPTPAEISKSAADILAIMLGENGVDEIINNPRFSAHFIVARCHGALAFEEKYKQLPALMRAGFANMLSRKKLARYFDRVTFGKSELTICDPYRLGNEYVPLTSANLADALLASGSIPMVMTGISNIKGACEGMYRDGGIIDYHFDLSFAHQQQSNKLTLYPHFYPQPIPGWFDKNLPARTLHKSSYDNVVMLVPSAEFVASLPYQKISDRKDFVNLSAKERIPYWQTIIKESDRLGEVFMQGVESGQIIDKIQDLPFKVK